MARICNGGRSPRTARRLAILLLVAIASGALAGSAMARPFATSPFAVVTSGVAPKITKQPGSVTVNEGQSATFSATASGEPAPTVQWELSTDGGTTWKPIAGATSGSYTIAATSFSENGYRFRAVFTNESGNVNSTAATLTVRQAPAVTLQPTNQVVPEGGTATFESTASGNPAPTVQWQVSTNGGGNWSNVAGATSTKLTFSHLGTSSNGRQYRAVFTNVVGTATSEAATLTVATPPVISKNPSPTTANEGTEAVFEAAASGNPAPTVQWEVSTDGGASWNAIPGATNPRLGIPGVVLAESGRKYRAVFTNAGGSKTTTAATLTVHSPPVVTQQPASITVEVGESATFESAATGTPTPTVQWQVSSDEGATWTTYPGRPPIS